MRTLKLTKEQKQQLHGCVYCVGHKKADFVAEVNTGYYKKPYPVWIRCTCSDCRITTSHGFSLEEAIANWNKFMSEEASFGQLTLAVFKATHR